MRLVPLILVACLAFTTTATQALAMTAAETASMHQFEQQCRAVGGNFIKIKLDVYGCKYPTGVLKVCNYAGLIGYCYATDPTLAHDVAAPRQSLGVN